MLVVAATFTAGWAALTTGVTTLVGTLGAVVLTQRSARKAERERAEHAAQGRAADHNHERELRELELRDARLALLHADRRSAYRELRLRYLAQRRLAEEHHIWWGHYQHVTRQKPIDVEAADEAMAKARALVEQLSDARRAIEEALIDVDHVASRPVREKAADLREAIEDAARLGGKWWSTDGHDLGAYDAYQRAEQQVDERERYLRDAISTELRLD